MTLIQEIFWLQALAIRIIRSVEVAYTHWTRNRQWSRRIASDSGLTNRGSFINSLHIIYRLNRPVLRSVFRSGEQRETESIFPELLRLEFQFHPFQNKLNLSNFWIIRRP